MSPKKIMVVDDEADIRELLSRALTKAGYQVKTAASAYERRTPWSSHMR